MKRLVYAILLIVITAVTAPAETPCFTIEIDEAASTRDSVVVELGVDMGDLTTCDIFQITVEIPYGAGYKKMSNTSYFTRDTEVYTRAGVKDRGLTFNAITPYRKEARQLILIVDHTMAARTSGHGKFALGRYKLGRLAFDARELGDCDKYRVRIVNGDYYSTFATGNGNETRTPEIEMQQRFAVDKGTIKTINN